MDKNHLRGFWDRVTKMPSGCWEWTGAKTYKGYGIYCYGEEQIRAHRFAWRSTEGPIPQGLCVLHTCDNRACVRPFHLFLGTAGDNNRDRHLKGRSRGNTFGLKAKALTREPGMQLLADIGLSEVARRLGISRAAVSQWDRVPDHRLIELERVTGIPREKLRPDLFER